MPRRQRDYAAEYRARAERARARGTTYGRERYAQDVARARAEGYRSPGYRTRARRDDRLRAAVDEYLAPLQLPDRDEVDKRITALSRRFGIRDADLYDILESDDRWSAFRAWYSARMGWAA